MKILRFILKPYKIDEVREALEHLGVSAMTVWDCKGFDRQKKHTELYRGAECVFDFLPKVYCTVVVQDEQVEVAIGAIVQAARTGKIGDGKIFVEDVEEAVRVRTGERGPSVL